MKRLIITFVFYQIFENIICTNLFKHNGKFDNNSLDYGQILRKNKNFQLKCPKATKHQWSNKV